MGRNVSVMFSVVMADRHGGIYHPPTFPTCLPCGNMFRCKKVKNTFKINYPSLFPQLYAQKKKTNPEKNDKPPPKKLIVS